MTNNRTEILIVENITKCYIPERIVLNNISFTAQEGEIIGIVGKNGCGKSTLLKIISGLDKNYDGRLFFKGQQYTHPSSNIIFLHQSYDQLFPWLTVEKNVALPMKKVLNMKNKDAINKAHWILGELGIEKNQFTKYPHTLSGGQKQRVAIARALCLNADIILMDEPFAAVDESSRIQFQKLIKGLAKNKKITIIMVSHSADEINNIADKVIKI